MQTVVLEPADVDRFIRVLEVVKHDHYRSVEDACPAEYTTPGPCDCGADKVNAKIDGLIDELKRRSADTVNSDVSGSQR